MRKIFTLALAAAAVLSVNAQQKAPGFTTRQLSPELSMQAPKAGKQMRDMSKVEGFRAFDKEHLVKGHASRAGESIYVAPGEEQYYSVNSEGFYMFWFWTVYGETNAITTINTDGNDVYFKNILVNLGSGAYAQGTKDGNKITVQLPQTIGETYLYSDDPDYGYDETDVYELTLLQKYYYDEVDEETGETTTYFDYAPVTEDNFVTYTIAEDGTITLDGWDVEYDEEGYLVEYPEYMLGATSYTIDHLNNDVATEALWAGYGDWAQTYTINNAMDNVVTLPEGIDMDPNWVLSDGYNSKFLSVGFMDDKVYIQGFSELVPDGVIYGNYDAETGQYTFPNVQTIGYSEDYGVFIYLVGTSVDYELDEDDYTIYHWQDLVFNFDSRTQRLISAQDQLMWENASDVQINYWAYFTNPYFFYQTEDDMNACPANPVYNYYNVAYDEFNFTLPTTNQYGYIYTDLNCLYYNIYVNGELYTYFGDEGEFYDRFTDEDTDEDAEWTDIPYYLAEYNYLYWYPNGFTGIAVPAEGVESIGVQVFYHGSDGILYRSNIVTGYKDDTYIVTEDAGSETDGIQSIVTSNEVKSVEFFNLSGVRVANPNNGIYVVRTTMSDGTVKTSKVALR